MYESTCGEDEGCPTPFYFACASQVWIDRNGQNGAACEDSLRTSNNMNIKKCYFVNKGQRIQGHVPLLYGRTHAIQSRRAAFRQNPTTFSNKLHGVIHLERIYDHTNNLRLCASKTPYNIQSCTPRLAQERGTSAYRKCPKSKCNNEQNDCRVNNF